MIENAQWRNTYYFTNDLSCEQNDTDDKYECEDIAYYSNPVFRKQIQLCQIGSQPYSYLPAKKYSKTKGQKRNNLFDESVKQAFYKSYSHQTYKRDV
jgi:hypothetical protein